MYRFSRLLVMCLLLSVPLFAIDYSFVYERHDEQPPFTDILNNLPAHAVTIAYVYDVYDGDTCTVILKIWGEGKDEAIFVLKKIRLYGVDTPELRTTDLNEKERGYAARDFARARILGKHVRLEMVGKEKFGRYMAILYYKDANGTEINLNQELISAGHATEYFGGKRSF